MNVYLGKDRHWAEQHLTASHSIVKSLKKEVEGFGHKLYMDSFFSSPYLYEDLAQKIISCYGTFRPHGKSMPKDLRPKTMRLKRGDIRVRTSGDLSAVVWEDKRDVRLLTNIHDPPREGNYCDEHGNVIKPAIIDVTRGRLTIQIGWPIFTRPAVEYGSGPKKFFPPVGLEHCQQLHPFTFMRFEENLHRDFGITLTREMLARAGHEPRPSIPVGRPAQTSTNIVRLNTRHNKHGLSAIRPNGGVAYSPPGV